MSSYGHPDEDLVDGLDDLPIMMNRIHYNAAVTKKSAGPSSSSSSSTAAGNEHYHMRFQELGPNQSFNMAYTLGGNEEHTTPNNQLANQAQRVLSHLTRMKEDRNHGPVKSVGELSKAAEQKLRALSARGVDLTKFYTQYDPQRSGSVSYKDFSDTLLAMSSGIGREDALILASTLDKKKSGQIEYKSILASLQELQKDKSLSNTMSIKGSTTDTAPSSYSAQYAAKVNPPAPGSSQKRNNSNSLTAAMQDSASDSYLKLYQSKVNPYTNLPPQEVVNVQILSPNKDNSRSAKMKSDISEDERRMYSGRRLYHDEKESNCHTTRIIAERLNTRTSPFYVEPTLDEVKKTHPKRALSAPPRSVPLAQAVSASDAPPLPRPVLSDSPPKKTSRSTVATTSNNTLSQEELNNKSIRVSLEKKLRASPKASSDADLDPHKHALARQHEDILKRQQQAKQTQSRVLENNIIRQLAGKVNNLRHVLKVQDRSQSGVLNFPEFRKALIHCGVQMSPDETEQLFSSMAEKKGSNIDTGFSHGKAIDIEAFVHRIQHRTTAPAFSHVLENMQSAMGQKVNDLAKANEESRIIKKVLSSISKIGEPKRLFDSVKHRDDGWLTQDEFKETLQLAGANLPEHEYRVLLETLNTGDHGKVEIGTIDKVLQQQLSKIDQQEQQHKQQLLQHYKHYNNTFRTTMVLGDSKQEFERVIDSKRIRKDQLQWYKLRDSLQKSYDKVLDAFKPSSQVDDDNAVFHNPHLSAKKNQARHTSSKTEQIQEITFSQLRRNLAKGGVNLGENDVGRIQNHLIDAKKMNPNEKDPKLSIEDFCEVIGIPIRYNDHNHRMELIDSHLNIRDEGIFASSEKSIASADHFSASIFSQSEKDIQKSVLGERKRKYPQPLSAYSKDPSKFWEMVKSVENPMAFAYPMASCRDPLPSNKPKVSGKGALRGYVSVSDAGSVGSGSYYHEEEKAAPAKPRLTFEELMKMHNKPEFIRPAGEADTRSQDTRSISTKDDYLAPRVRGGGSNGSNGGSKKRSSSAPPRSSNVSEDGSVGYAKSVDSRHSGVDSVSANINKWANSNNNNTLADYYQEKTIRGGGSGKTNHEESAATTPNSIASGSTASFAAGKTGNFSNPSTPNGARASLNKHFDHPFGSQSAPYATDNN